MIESHVDLDLERQVLGQVLAFPHTFAGFEAAGVDGRDFFRVEHRYVWEAISALAMDGVAPDISAVGRVLRERDWLTTVGAAYFSALVDGMPCPGEPNMRYAAGALRQLTRGRALLTHTDRLRKALEENVDALAEGVLEEHLRAVDAVVRDDTSLELLDAAHQLDALRHERERERQQAVLLGLPSLDNILNGIRPGEVCGVMARPGIGKTLLLCHFIRTFAEFSLGHLCCSLEMPAAQIVQRVIRMVHHLGRWDVERAIDTQTFEVQAYADLFVRWRLTDRPSLSVDQIGRFARDAARQVPLRVVSVDHLGLIGGDRQMSTYDRVSTQARELKELAKRQNVAVVLLIQVNRDAGGDGSRELTLGAARDSGVVEEAVDYLVGVRRFDRATWLDSEAREQYRDVLWLKVLKNRHGELGRELAVRFDGRTLAMQEDQTLDPPKEPDLRDGARRGR